MLERIRPQIPRFVIRSGETSPTAIYSRPTVTQGMRVIGLREPFQPFAQKEYVSFATNASGELLGDITQVMLTSDLRTPTNRRVPSLPVAFTLNTANQLGIFLCVQGQNEQGEEVKLLPLNAGVNELLAHLSVEITTPAGDIYIGLPYDKNGVLEESAEHGIINFSRVLAPRLQAEPIFESMRFEEDNVTVCQVHDREAALQSTFRFHLRDAFHSHALA